MPEHTYPKTCLVPPFFLSICINVKNQHDQTVASEDTTNKSYKVHKAHTYAKKSAAKK